VNSLKIENLWRHLKSAASRNWQIKQWRVARELLFARIPVVRFTWIAAILVSLPAFADHTRRWRQSSYDEFLKGTARGVSVRSDGRLELSPKFSLLADADASYLWSLHLDPKGSLYAAGGSPARVFRFDPSGKPTIAFESSDLNAQAIAFDAKGTLYVATSPDGKIYKVSSPGDKSVFFDPKSKYIWDLAFGPDGTLYVATGDKGQLFAVAPDGKSELFYASDEAHIRVLAFDGKGSVLAGTEPSGRILRLTRSTTKPSEGKAAAEGFVIYETAKREVTSLAVAPDGSVYAAAIGEKQRPTGSAPSTVIVTPQGAATVSSTGAVSVAGQPQGQTPFVPFPPALSSSIYRISPDGAPEELWTSRDEVVYALGLASDNRLLAGTGNSGALLAIDGRGVFAQLAKSGSAQITAIARSSNGKIYLCTANPGKVFSVGPEYEPEGTFESHSFDAQLFSQWGRLDWWSPPPASSGGVKPAAKAPRVEFFVRSGNTEDPGKEWSRWFGPYTTSGRSIEAPPARFIQWKAIIHDGIPGDGLDWVTVAYQPRNVAPLIDGIAIQDPGIRAQAPNVGSPQQQPVSLKMPAAQAPAGPVFSSGPAPRFEQPPQGFRDKGWQSVVWAAHDENEDDLRFAIYFRGENETEWKLLRDKLEQKFFAFDTTTLPDGAYYLKIVASDAPSNPQAFALTTERESERFEVDNTPPVVENVHIGSGKASGLPIDFTARDAATSVERAEYSVDGGEWLLAIPDKGVSDSPAERYHGTLPALTGGEHSVAVRAFDRFDNVGSAKLTITVPR
jgi:WD40 repeat protein